MNTTTYRSAPARYVFFDLDHTLIPMDSDFGWGSYTVDIGWVERGEFMRRNEGFYAEYRQGTMDIHAYIEFATRALRNHSPQECAAALDAYIRNVVAHQVRPQALELVRQHQRLGDTVVLVTATNAFVTTPIAPLFGIGHLIAVELAKDPTTHWYNGQIAGTPSFRAGKVTRVQQWLHAQGTNLEQATTVFYSDSINDLPLLEAVKEPVATNPDPSLRAIAVARGWRVLELFQEAAPQ